MSSVSGNVSYLYLTFMIHEPLPFWGPGRKESKILEPDVTCEKSSVFSCEQWKNLDT